MRQDRDAFLGWCAVLAALLASGAASGQALAQAVDTRRQANEEAVASQKRIDALSDKTDELLTEYRNTLKQIESLRVYNKQMEELIGAQQEELADLQDQIDRVELVGRGVTPLMLKMIDALGRFVELDTPFLPDERRERVASLRELMNRSDVTDSEKYRRITEAYQIENEFGRTIEAYRDELDRDGPKLTVDFLRFGRVALVYLTLDGNEAGVWNPKTRAWEKLDSSYRASIKEGLRVARKLKAPEFIRLPIQAATDAGGPA